MYGESTKKKKKKCWNKTLFLVAGPQIKLITSTSTSIFGLYCREKLNRIMFCLVREAAEKKVIFLMAVPLKGGGGEVEHLPERKKIIFFGNF